MLQLNSAFPHKLCVACHLPENEFQTANSIPLMLLQASMTKAAQKRT